MFNIALGVVKQISKAGFKAYIIGGFPRDYYLGRESIDVDICTNATPKEVKSIFEDSIAPKQQYGGVTVIVDNIRFEITTFRKEIRYISHRFPVEIKFVDDLIPDLERRDFIINTLCIDKNGEYLDLLGAKGDIDLKIIRTVQDSDFSINTDILRSLRAIRFATVLNFKISDDLKKSITKYRDLLRKLSYDRKKDELEKIFLSPNAKYGVSLIKELKLDKSLELKNIEKLVITTDIISMWAQLDVVDVYTFSSEDKKTIRKIKELMDIDMLDDYVLYKYGVYYCTLAGEIKNINRREIVKKYNELLIKSPKDIVIKGNEIANLLNKPVGPYIKDILTDIEKKIINKQLGNNVEVLKKYILKEYL